MKLFYHDNDLVVTATKSEKPISQVAENISVVTAEEIEAMNAHTVADVLNHVTGLQLKNSTGPGNASSIIIQGSENQHVLVMIDGVVQNSLGEMYPDVSAIRVQHIDRIEVVKGPASSSWGSSLGGIVNIITKSPDVTRRSGGAISASIGSRNIGDYRAELSGTLDSLGYYLSGGGLLSDGLRPNTMLDSGNIYSKLEWRPTDSSVLTLTVGYDSASRGLSEFMPIFSFHNYYQNFFTTLALQQKLSTEWVLDLALRGSLKHSEIRWNDYSSGEALIAQTGDDRNFGGTGQLRWMQQRHNLIIGTDFDLGELESPLIVNGLQHLDKWAIYANDTLKLGSFSITPGIRYDYTNTNGDFFSPSLGATCSITDSTVIRAYIAKGFNIPPLAYTFSTIPAANPNLKMERVWSYSAGIETAAVPYIWLKATYFRHDASDAINLETMSNENQRREGVEVELKTKPVFNISLTGGFTFIHAKNRSTGDIIKDVPRYVYDLGVQFDNKKLFYASLKGRKIDWNASDASFGKYNAMIWDLNLSKKFQFSGRIAAEAFFTAHNLFNGSQYSWDLYKSPRRWFEGGLRFSF